MKRIFAQLILVIAVCISTSAKTIRTEVLIIGGGASGTMAGIQAARLGATSLIIEEGPWLGGMLTSAGVSAVDGNYRLHSGLWEEFRQNLNKHYGGKAKLKTGWVSNVLFEPQVGEKILSDMVKQEENLKVLRETVFLDIEKNRKGWLVKVSNANKTLSIQANIVIDATELGDISKKVGIPYDIGMDSRHETSEDIAPEKANNIIQDLTYVAILKDYGYGTDKTIAKPEAYNPALFYCTCAGKCLPDSIERTLWPCDKMMGYGKLPNNYYMINWPIYGNDFYLNLIELSPDERENELYKAKNFTLQYIYYLQSELGFKNLGIADDVFPTKDGLPLIPYHRESRRIKGLVQFTVNDLAQPFEQESDLYRTGIAVGDYPIDHHHAAYPESEILPDLHFYPVPSYSLPLGTLIPKSTPNFIVTEKSISVTNLVNGTTRLQPVCLLIGQAAGTLAALSVKNNITPKNVSVRKVQTALLNTGAFLMPYSDVSVNRISFKAIQRIGACGILKGEGKNIGWENHTHFYPDSSLSATALKDGLSEWFPVQTLNICNEIVTYEEALKTIKLLANKYQKNTYKDIEQEAKNILNYYQIATPEKDKPISREGFSVLLDTFIQPFELKDVNHSGNFLIK